jgi:hypothetical protein
MRKKPKASKGSGVSTDAAKQAWEIVAADGDGWDDFCIPQGWSPSNERFVEVGCSDN